MGNQDQTGRLVEAADLLLDPAGQRLGATTAFVLPTDGLRGHLELAEENGGYAPWCGPAVLALATGRGYHAAGELLRKSDRSFSTPKTAEIRSLNAKLP